MGWIIAFFLDEAATTPLGYWDGDSIALVADEVNAGDALNSAQFNAEAAGITLETMRSSEGEFQQQFTNYDVRMLRAEQTIALV